MTEKNLNELVRDGLRSDGTTTYEEWDIVRRELFAESAGGHAAVEGVKVQHAEYESYLFCEGTGRTVATWYQSTGDCNVMAPEKAAEAVAALVSNLINNSLKHGWGDVS